MQQSSEMRTVVVWGLGGAGKSQLALRYVQQHQQRYQAIFWIEAGQRTTIERDYIQAYRLVHPQLSSSEAAVSPEVAILGLKDWLQGQEARCLWVMDSADDVEDDKSEHYIDLLHYLPAAPQLDRIVTTRSSRISGMSKQGAIEVKEMSEVEAVDIFWRCAGLELQHNRNEQEATKIVQELGCLALAVTLAGSYVREDPDMSSNIKSYLVEFQKRRGQLLNQKPHRLVHQYGESVLSTWEISVDRIRRQSPVAYQLLSVLGCLNLDDIFLELFVVEPRPQSGDQRNKPDQRVGLRSSIRRMFRKRTGQKLDHGHASPLQKLKWIELLSSSGPIIDHHSIKAGFRVLQAYSLVSWRDNQQSYSMHKLVHAWAHDRLSAERRQSWASAVLELLSVSTCEHVGNLDIEQRIVPHIIANFAMVSATAEGGHEMPAVDRECLGRVADLLRRLGRWSDESEVRMLLQQLTSLELGHDHPDTLISMNRLAAALDEQGKHEQAEQIHRETLELAKGILGHKHPHTIIYVNNLARMLRRQGRNEEADIVQALTTTTET